MHPLIIVVTDQSQEQNMHFNLMIATNKYIQISHHTHSKNVTAKDHLHDVAHSTSFSTTIDSFHSYVLQRIYRL